MDYLGNIYHAWQHGLTVPVMILFPPTVSHSRVSDLTSLLAVILLCLSVMLTPLTS